MKNNITANPEIWNLMIDANFTDRIQEAYGDRAIWHVTPINETPKDMADRLNSEIRYSYPRAYADGNLVKIEMYYSIGD